MTSVRAVGTSTAVFKGEDGFKSYKTLKIEGDAKKDDAPIEIKFDGHRYSRQEIDKGNGNKEIMYVCIDEDPTDVKGKEAEKFTVEKTCEDGKDDGEISWDEILWSMGKGIVKPFKDMFNFSSTKETWKSIGKIGLAVGIGALCVALPGVGLALAGIGAVMGAATLTTGIVQAKKSKKDADTKAACENIGNGAFTMITSLLGFKAMKNSIATKATAIEKATNINGINKIGTVAKAADSADDTIKTAGILTKAVDGVKNAKNAVVSTIKPEVGNTTQTLKNISQFNTTGLTKAKVSNSLLGMNTGVSKNAVTLNTVQFHGRNALRFLENKNMTAAYDSLQKAKALIPYLSEEEQSFGSVQALLHMEKAISAIPKVTTSVKGTTAVVAANGGSVENMFITPETQKIQAYEFVS